MKNLKCVSAQSIYFSILFIISFLFFTESGFTRSLGFNFKSSLVNQKAHNGLEIKVYNDLSGADITFQSHIEITPTVNGLQTVAVSSTGFSDTLIVGLPRAGVLEVFLVPQYSLISVPVISGELTDWDYPKRSKNLYTAALFKTLSAFDLLSIDQDSFLSPLMDQIDVFGKRDIPSNIALPEQTLQVFPFSIKINKPKYRLPVKSIYPTSLSAVQLHIPGSVLAKMATGGGEIGLNILNKGTLSAVGTSKNFLPERSESISFSAIHKLAPRYKVKIDKPKFATDVLVASFVDLYGEREVLIPSDLKTVEVDKNGKISDIHLASPVENMGHSREIMALALSEKGKKSSGVVVNPQNELNVNTAFLPIQDLPLVSPLPEKLKVTPLKSGMSVIILEGTREGNAKENELLARVFILPLVGSHEVVLPKSSHEVQAYSVMDLDFGPHFNESNFNGSSAMKELVRFSRTSVDIEKKKDSFNWKRVFFLNL